MIVNHHILISSRLETWRILQSFTDLVCTYTRRVHAYVDEHVPRNLFYGTCSFHFVDVIDTELSSDHVFSGVTHSWFCYNLPLWASVRFVDNLLTEVFL